MEIRRKKMSELTRTEYRACYAANYGEQGYMRLVLVDTKRDDDVSVILLWDGPDDRVSSLIGWALITPVGKHYLLGVTPWVKKRSKITAQFWVKRQHRRKGYGGILMQEVKKIDSRPHVIPHSLASMELFSSFDVQVLKSDRQWVRKKPRVA